MTEITLDTQGPHSPDYTRQVASTVSEAIRVLNYATQDPAGLKYPADVYDVIGGMRDGFYGLDQLIHQLSVFISRLEKTGQLRATHGPYQGHPEQAVAATLANLDQMKAAAATLYEAAKAAHASMNALSIWTPDEDEPDE